MSKPVLLLVMLAALATAPCMAAQTPAVDAAAFHDSDYQVTPKDDFAPWQAAFAHNPRITLREYPTLSHLMMPGGEPPSPADYARPGHVDARVIDDIVHWIKTQPAR